MHLYAWLLNSKVLPDSISFNHDKKVGGPLISLIYSLQPNKKALRFDCKALMVDEVEKSLHPITEELKRWQSFIGEHYIEYKVAEQRNRLANKPWGYTTSSTLPSPSETRRSG